MHVPVQTRELPLPALEKPAVQVHPVAPALLVLPAGQAVQVADPAVALYVLASQTVTCARGGGREGGAGRDGAVCGFVRDCEDGDQFPKYRRALLVHTSVEPLPDCE